MKGISTITNKVSSSKADKATLLFAVSQSMDRTGTRKEDHSEIINEMIYLTQRTKIFLERIGITSLKANHYPEISKTSFQQSTPNMELDRSLFAKHSMSGRPYIKELSVMQSRISITNATNNEYYSTSRFTIGESVSDRFFELSNTQTDANESTSLKHVFQNAVNKPDYLDRLSDLDIDLEYYKQRIPKEQFDLIMDMVGVESAPEGFDPAKTWYPEDF